MNEEQNIELKRMAAKDLLRSLVNEVLDDFLGVDQTYSQEEIAKAERGLAYLLEEGVNSEDDTVLDPWGGPGEEAVPAWGGPLTDSDRAYIEDGVTAENDGVCAGLFLDIGDCRFVVGPDGFQFIDEVGDCMTIAPDHLPYVARLFRQATDVGYIEYMPNR